MSRVTGVTIGAAWLVALLFTVVQPDVVRAARPAPGSGAGRPAVVVGPSPTLLTLTASIAATTAGLATFVALMLPYLRRPASKSRRPAASMASASMEPDPVDLSGDPDDSETEAQMPRWRRQSIHGSWPDNPSDPAVRRAPIVFDTPARPGVSRCRIAYRLVRLGSEPDDRGGQEIGRLDRGDEVEVVRQLGGFCLVRTPTGAQGWVAGLTLSAAPSGPQNGSETAA